MTLREALEEANLPTLLVALAHLTGDERWVSDPYRPGRLAGPGDNDSGGFDEAMQSRIRDEAHAVLTAGVPEVAPPTPEAIEAMLSIALGGLGLPAGCGSMLAEELGVHTREVDLSACPEGFSVLVIGAGFSGLNAALQLTRAGVDCTVLEKNELVGGTWLENTYPGCGVDTPSHLYSYSFAQRADWGRYFTQRDDLHAYLDGMADGVRDRIRFQTEAATAAWHEDHWEVVTTAGETLTANALITGVGFLNRPAYPRIDGLETFAGPITHTATWPADLDVTGKRVAVLGTGASAMQLVPSIAGVAEHVTVFQRSAQWAVPHPNYKRAVSPAVQQLMRDVPHYLGWYRLRQVWLFGDRLHQKLRWDRSWPDASRSVNAWNDGLRQFLTDYVRDELGERADELLPKCVPDYPPYGKRPLIDNGWWRAMARDDVTLVTDDVTAIEPGAVVAGSERHEVDVLVLATGFQAVRVLHPIEVRGRSGRALAETWGDDDARAYLGVTVPDLPNFFLLLGPNTFPGHGGSGVLTSEIELRYVMETLRLMFERGLSSVEVRQDVHDAYNERLDEALDGTIWAHPGMTTYYRNSRGRIVVPMPWSNAEYWHMTRTPSLDDYYCTERSRM